MLLFRPGRNGWTDGSNRPALERREAIEICETVCASCDDSVAGLRNLIDLLRHAESAEPGRRDGAAPDALKHFPSAARQ